MSGELEYILRKWQLDPDGQVPLGIQGSRHTDLVMLFRELDYAVGAEIGVEEGRYSEEICKANPGVRLYCIDPWLAYNRGGDLYEQAKLDKRREEAMKRLAPYGCEIVRKSSTEAVKSFAPDALDFVFIDGNHEFEFVVNDIIVWHKVVRPGGILAGHDYVSGHKGQWPLPFHVIQAVNAYTDAYKVRPWFLFKKDTCPSWMWVKTIPVKE